MATPLRNYPPTRALSHAKHTVPRFSVVKFAGVYMEQEESRDEVEFLGTAGVCGALFTMGFDGV